MEKNILVVDDEESILVLMKDIFESADYTTYLAQNAEEAMRILNRENIFVMFLDIMLPGMNGLDLCREIRFQDKISIINAFTGFSNIYGFIECRAAGFDDFFVKPVPPDLILKAAKEAFEKLDRWKVR